MNRNTMVQSEEDYTDEDQALRISNVVVKVAKSMGKKNKSTVTPPMSVLKGPKSLVVLPSDKNKDDNEL